MKRQNTGVSFLDSYAQGCFVFGCLVGTPINSPLDDNHFSLSFDGMTATFSSNRIGTLGGFDLYLAYYKDQVMDQLMYTETLPFINYGQDSLIENKSTLALADDQNLARFYSRFNIDFDSILIKKATLARPKHMYKVDSVSILNRQS